MDNVDARSFNSRSLAIFSEVSAYLPENIKKDLSYLSRSRGKIPRTIGVAGVTSDNRNINPRLAKTVDMDSDVGFEGKFKDLVEHIFSFDESERAVFLKKLDALSGGRDIPDSNAYLGVDLSGKVDAGGVVKFSFKNSNSGRANDLLIPYDEELIQIITGRGDYIVYDFESLQKIVNQAFESPEYKATAYFGTIPENVLKNIEINVPNIPKELNGVLFKSGKDYSIAATFDSIRHLKDGKNLSIDDIVEYLDRMSDTIVDFDSVYFDYYHQGGAKINGLVFKKIFSDGVMQSFEIVSNKKRTLNLQTIYMEKGDYTKKKFAETMPMEKPSADVQDAGQSNFNNSIPNLDKKVNEKFSTPSGNDIKFDISSRGSYSTQKIIEAKALATDDSEFIEAAKENTKQVQSYVRSNKDLQKRLENAKRQMTRSKAPRVNVNEVAKVTKQIISDLQGTEKAAELKDEENRKAGYAFFAYPAIFKLSV